MSDAKTTFTVVHFLQCDRVTGLEGVTHLIETHARWKECAWCHVSHDQFMSSCLIGDHEIDFFLCLIGECQIGWRENGVCSAALWILWREIRKSYHNNVCYSKWTHYTLTLCAFTLFREEEEILCCAHLCFEAIPINQMRIGPVKSL